MRDLVFTYTGVDAQDIGRSGRLLMTPVAQLFAWIEQRISNGWTELVIRQDGNVVVIYEPPAAVTVTVSLLRCMDADDHLPFALQTPE